MEIRIEGDFEAKDLQVALEETLSAEEDVEFRPARARSSTRFVTGLEPMALLAILKAVAPLVPLVVGLVNYLRNKNPGKIKTLKIIAQDDSALVVPEDTSRESLSLLLEQQPKFQNPKLITIE
jgi:hypothetical protein